MSALRLAAYAQRYRSDASMRVTPAVVVSKAAVRFCLNTCVAPAVGIPVARMPCKFAADSAGADSGQVAAVGACDRVANGVRHRRESEAKRWRVREREFSAGEARESRREDSKWISITDSGAVFRRTPMVWNPNRGLGEGMP